MSQDGVALPRFNGNTEPVIPQHDSAFDGGRGGDVQHELLHALPVAVYTTDAAGHITFYNEAAAALWGCRPKLNSDQWCGSWRMYWPDGTPLPHDECPMAVALKEKRNFTGGQEAVAEQPDGTRIPFMAFPSLLRDAAGEVVGALNMFVDISERKRNEELAQRLASIVESSEDAIIGKNFDGIITSWNKSAERLFGYTADEAIGKPVTILIPADRQDEEEAILRHIRSGQRVEHFETIRQRKDGGLIDISLTISPIKNSFGKIIGASKIARDITERKQSEAHIATLAREAEHRAKNVLATVQATVHLTQSDTPEGLKQAIAGRIQALANVHTLFVDSRWAGAELHHLVAQELSPYCREGDARARIDGAPVLLEPTAAQAVAVCLHELTTNAAKHGALSSPEGRVDIAWSRAADGRLILRWTEANGPLVAQPARRGFGMRVMERMAQSPLKGEIHFAWLAQGLACEITMTD
jgi:two-component system CheB/CheR fusion protein